ncbi:Fic family protein [Marinomonas sp. 15G1-11]|uniref:Fic family protein n=1 Tax=Marinomonas phaeophyticola TaxID=3004091 RepID=A0ABT4JXL6_9GAMM|nr:Fic family protein [Marinomonas sp. 15G1-11]MCZ2722970.1 Fic family protein [Marinomonas sp. 15G1-11]
MARIRTPKSLEELLKNTSHEEFVSLLGKFTPTDSEGKYLHWDKFIWRLPKGVSEQGAWIATKLSRKAISKTIPLEAEKDSFFSYCIPDSLHAQLHHIDKLCGGGHAIGDGSFISTKEKDRYLVKNLMMEEAITSSQLEGASTTRKVAKEMLETKRKPIDKSEQMIFNNYLLMKKALERKDESLSIELILELHEIATFEAIDNDAVPGALRENNNIAVSNLYNELSHNPPCFTSLKERLNSLCDFANSNHDGQNTDTFIHPLVKAIILHFMIGFIHPFGDGNGRTARALFYWYMLSSGYWLFEYVSISKLIQEKRSDYDTAFIYTETDEFDLTYFIYHQVDIVSKAVNSLNDHIESKKSEFYQFMEWIDKSPISKNLKRGQLELLKEAVKQPGKMFISKQVAMELDINENTARSYLNGLVEADLLVASKSKKNKAIIYLAPAGLREKLKI